MPPLDLAQDKASEVHTPRERAPHNGRMCSVLLKWFNPFTSQLEPLK